jgi:putative transposase
VSPEQVAAAGMVAEARRRGLELTGPNGLLKLFTKNVLETALNEEMTEHLGHGKNRTEPGRDSTNVRNGRRKKTVLSDAVGEVEIEVPRDRGSTFEPPDCEEKAASVHGCGRDRVVVVRERVDYRGNFGAFCGYP